MEMLINGTLDLEFFELDGTTPVTEPRNEEIKNKLKSGHYVIGLASGDVFDLNNIFEAEAKFKFSVCDDTEYTFVTD
jgi:hypothetical protein